RAKEFGADAVVDPGSDDPVRAIKDLTQGGADLTLDTSGAEAGRLAAVSSDLLRKQLTLIASWTFSSIGQAECADFVARRQIDVDRLFTHRWTLDQAAEAYQLFDRQSAGKGVFLM